MSYGQLDAQISKRLAADTLHHGSRRRLVCYALDREILSDRDFRAFPVWFKEHFGDDEHGKLDWLLENKIFFCLYLMRLFFEETDGASYNVLVQDRLGLSRRIGDGFFSACVDSGLFEAIDRDCHPRFNMQKLLVECWVFMHGPTSEIWRSLIPLVRALPKVKDDIELGDFAEDFLADRASAPFSLEYLAGKRDSDFIDSLRHMHASTPAAATGWGKHLSEAWAEHAHGNSASTGWAINTTPGRMQLLLTVRDLTLLDKQRKIEFIQDGRILPYDLDQYPHESLPEAGIRYGFLSFTPQILQEILRDTERTGINSDRDFVVRYGKKARGEEQEIFGLRLDEPTLGGPLVFRWAVRKTYAPLLSPEIRQVHSARLILVWPHRGTPVPRLKWGNQFLDDCVDCANTCKVQTTDGTLLLPTQVVTIPGERLQGTQPLVWIGHDGEHEIVRVGARPRLEVENADPEIALADSDLQVCFDDQAVILGLRNLPATETVNPQDILLQDSGDWHIHEDGRSLSLASRATAEVGCRHRPSGSGVRVIRFPAAVREVVLGTGVVKDWSWQDDPMDWSNDEDITHFVTEDSFVLHGVLTSPGGHKFRMTRPPDSVRFWWRGTGVNYGRITAGQKNFESLAELRECYLCAWVPGNATLRLEQETLRRLPSGYQEIPLHGLIVRDSHGYQFESMPTLTLGDETVAVIWQLPGRPSLQWYDGRPMVYFPSEFPPHEYRVAHFSEERLLSPLRVEACAGLAQDAVNPIHIDVPDCGYWLALVKADRNFDDLLRFCLDRDKYVEDVLEVNPSPKLRLEQRLLGEQYLQPDSDERRQKLEKAVAFLDLVATEQRKGGFPQTVLTDAIRDRCSLSVAAEPLTTEFDKLFQETCALDHLEETLQTLLDHSLNVFARRNWCDKAFDTIREKYPRWTEKRMKKLLEIAPAVLGIVAVHEGHPYASRRDQKFGLVNQRMKSLAFLYKPDGAVVLRCPTSDIPAFREPMGVRQISQEGLSFEHDRRNHKLVFSPLDGISVKDPAGTMVPIRIEHLDPQSYCYIIASYEFPGKDAPPLFGKKAYRHGIHEAVNAPHRFLSAELAQRLDSLFENALSKSSSLLGTHSEGRLAGFFAAKVAQCREWEEEAEYRNRTFVWQAVIISRLSCWCPDAVGRLVTEEGNARVLCDVIGSAFRHCRPLLMNDLVLVEWLIAWFGDHRTTSHENSLSGSAGTARSEGVEA